MLRESGTGEEEGLWLTGCIAERMGWRASMARPLRRI